MSTLNPVPALVTALIGKMDHPSDVTTEIIELLGNETYRLEPQEQIIWVLSGWAWITLDGADQIVREGEDMLVKPGKDEAIISSLHSASLVFEIRYL